MGTTALQFWLYQCEWIGTASAGADLLSPLLLQVLPGRAAVPPEPRLLLRGLLRDRALERPRGADEAGLLARLVLGVVAGDALREALVAAAAALVGGRGHEVRAAALAQAARAHGRLACWTNKRSDRRVRKGQFFSGVGQGSPAVIVHPIGLFVDEQLNPK